VEIVIFTEEISSGSCPTTAQTLRFPSTSVTLDAVPLNLTSGTPKTPVGRQQSH